MRKIKAHYIFDGTRFHKYGTLVIDASNTIIEIIPQSDIEEANTEFFSGIICPGFVNAHCHLELSHLHTMIPQQCGLPEFISHIVSLRNSIDQREEYMKQADILMRNNGIVAVGDISNTMESIVVKQNSSIHYHTFIELFDLFDDTHSKYTQGKQLFKECKAILPCSLSPHAPYSCSRTLIERITEHSKTFEYPITIHNQEHQSENEFLHSKSGELFEFFSSINNALHTILASGKSSIQTYSPWLPEDQHILFVHNTHTNAEDIDFISTHRSKESFTFVVCPKSNSYIAQEIPPLTLFAKKGISVAIGTDSLASNTTLSMLAEIQYLQEKFPEISLEYLLHCATAQGARALGIQKKYGSFLPGTKPGILLIEGIDLHNLKCTRQSRVKILA